jgi:AcrR family transcriptional regulator
VSSTDAGAAAGASMAPVAAPAGEKIRDAQRSRAAILAAAEQLFAERGYDGTSLSDIGAAAGLSRGTPSYFFGSKQKLYAEVLGRAFAARQQATERAFAPVHAWCEGDGGRELLREALAGAAAGYMDYLVEHPSFAALVMREELDGGRRLSSARGQSTAMQDAFQALRRAGARRGMRAFRVQEAVLLFVALTFAPFSFQNTLMRAVGRDLASPRGRTQQGKLAVEQMMLLLYG